MEGTQEHGRRERKKADTRRALLSAARSLFDAQGFSGTTVQQIVDLADVSDRTFFRYFQSKEDLLLPDIAGFLDRIAMEFEAAPSSDHPLGALLRAVEAVLRDDAAQGNILMLPLREPWNESMTARTVKVFIDWEQSLAGIMGDKIRLLDPGISDLDLFAGVMARCGVAAMRSTLWTLRDLGGNRLSGLDDSIRLLRRAFELIEPIGSLSANS
ncbi:MAG: TetR family transcriptional regulator [Acidimicrobiaceae bacterium]|nr:TetR family transcriptional regulator [Acidimicrobiaceae bacterium]